MGSRMQQKRKIPKPGKAFCLPKLILNKGLHLQIASVHDGGATCSVEEKGMKTCTHVYLLHLGIATWLLLSTHASPAPPAGVCRDPHSTGSLLVSLRTSFHQALAKRRALLCRWPCTETTPKALHGPLLGCPIGVWWVDHSCLSATQPVSYSPSSTGLREKIAFKSS